jgi:hypothetical protein
MHRVCRLIPNFAGDSFRRCQSFQEKDNLFSKGVNDSSKVSTCSGNDCQPYQEKSNKLSTKIRKRHNILISDF